MGVDPSYIINAEGDELLIRAAIVRKALSLRGDEKVDEVKALASLMGINLFR